MICRWNWCGRTFSDSKGLVEHVEQDHIATALPMNRKDVPLMLRAEDGTSLQESVVPRAWVSDSQSQGSPDSRWVERAVMTDLVSSSATIHTKIQVASPRQISERRPPPSRSAPYTPTQLSRPQSKENQPQLTFSELRGTPSPAPSLVPSSPGTTEVIRKMRQNMPFSFAPLRSSHGVPRVTSHIPYQKPSPKSNLPRGTLNGRGLPHTLGTPPIGDDDSDRGSIRAAGTDDPNASADIVEVQLLHDANDEMIAKSTMAALQSQWQPQSQLPLSGSMEDDISFSVSTVNPNQLHAPLRPAPDSQPIVQSDRNLSLEDITPNAARVSPNFEPSSSAASPPSPSTLDISNLTTGFPVSVRQTSSRKAFRLSQPSSTLQLSSGPDASTSELSQPITERQEPDLFAQGLPFDVGLGHEYGYGNGDSQPLQTQVPLLQSSSGTDWSQG